MNHRIVVGLSLSLVFIATGTLLAQGGGGNSGGLPPAARQSMESAMQRLENAPLMTTREELALSVGADKLEIFLDGAVVSLTLNPGGTYEAMAMDGGDIIGFTVGQQQVALEEDAEEAEREGWYMKSGAYKPPKNKKPQSVSLQVQAGPNQISVDCANPFKKSEEPVTYYVGPLDGLFCLGLSEETAG